MGRIWGAKLEYDVTNQRKTFFGKERSLQRKESQRAVSTLVASQGGEYKEDR